MTELYGIGWQEELRAQEQERDPEAEGELEAGAQQPRASTSQTSRSDRWWSDEQGRFSRQSDRFVQGLSTSCRPQEE